MRAELLTIGGELLKGSTLNTNAQFLGKELTHLGFDVQRQVSCPDTIACISETLGDSLRRSDLIILTGGLGPTPDDVTRDAVAEYFGVKLVISKKQYSEIKRHYQRFGRKVPSIVKKEAYFPESAVPLVNRHGIALGFYFEYDRKLIVVLPGVPSELRKMYSELILPLIRTRFPKLKRKETLVVKTVGLSEPTVMGKLKRDFFKDSFDFGIYPDAGEVTLRIQSDDKSVMKRVRSKVKKRLGAVSYALEELSLAETLGLLLKRKKKTLSIAESCTGGLLASYLTGVSGASTFFKGGVTAYSNELKEKLLDIPRDLLKKNGAVSSVIARKMASNVLKKMNTSFGIGITGIAGPRGGTKKKPVGLVYIALATPKRCTAWEYSFWGDRHQVQHKASKKALQKLWMQLK